MLGVRTFKKGAFLAASLGEPPKQITTKLEDYTKYLFTASLDTYEDKNIVSVFFWAMHQKCSYKVSHPQPPCNKKHRFTPSFIYTNFG